MNDKVRDPELAAFLLEGSKLTKKSIIIEARRTAINPSIGPRESDPILNKSMLQINEVLKDLGLRDDARIYELAGLFVLEVTPSELHRLVDLPFIQAIRLNRFHKRIEL